MSVASLKRLPNGIRHLTFDGCMFPTRVMEDPNTWTSVLDLGSNIIRQLECDGLAIEHVPKIHLGVWCRAVGRGPDSKLGEVISLDQILDWIEQANSTGVRKFNGIDLLETVDVPLNMEDKEFGKLVDRLKALNLVVGDVGACIWPDPKTSQQGAWGKPEDRDRMTFAVDAACKLWKRFESAGVASYGSIRVDSGSGHEDFAKDPKGNFTRLIDTCTMMANVASKYGRNVVFEGEICWGGMCGWIEALRLQRTVNRPNFLFMADTAHLLHFLTATNSTDEGRLLPQDWVVYDPKDDGLDFTPPFGAVRATKAQLLPAWTELARLIRPMVGSIHFAQSSGKLFGSGDHAKTGQHCPPNDPNGIVDVAKVVSLLTLG